MDNYSEVSSAFYSENEIESLKLANIGIAGCGGLGSNCAMLLVRAGVEKLTLVDFDIIVESNLNRQFFFADQIGENKVDALAKNLLRINPKLDLTLHKNRVDSSNLDELFSNCTFVVEAFDTPESKAMIASRYLLDETPFVCVSGIAGFGNSDRVKIRAIGKNSWIIGDGKTGVDIAPPLAPMVLVAAGKEADAVLSYTLEKRVKCL
jgi:sulfur carrier protein ThiS adenylyltransferase